MTEQESEEFFLELTLSGLTDCLSELQALEGKLREDGKIGKPEEYSVWQRIFLKTMVDALDHKINGGK